jgi:predicted lysophospholipase L1 biosynthesis ABC-type transport system permease subunit
VADLGVNPGAPSLSDGVYLPLRATNVVRVAVRADRLDPIVAWLDERAGAGQPAADVQWTRTLREQLDEPAFLYRGVGSALTSLGLVALLLACTGIHALVSLSVNERRRELAVRVALGAGRGRIIRSILSHTGWQLLVGSAAGLLLALAVMRAVDLLPFDVDGSDPSLVALTIAVLAGAGFAACLQPLRQALAIRPVDWLRG